MTYAKSKVLMYDPKKGYDKVADSYSKYHKLLNEWDKGYYQRFLPRDLKGVSILDIGGGDGRIARKWLGKGVGRYVLLDISEKLLSKINGKVEKVVHDLESPLDFKDCEFDLVFAFFVLLHINDIQQLFEEIYRILSPGGKFIVFHHIERRPFDYNIDSDKFKIVTYNHRYEDIEKLAEYCFFDVKSIDMIEDGFIVGKTYCFTK